MLQFNAFSIMNIKKIQKLLVNFISLVVKVLISINSSLRHYSRLLAVSFIFFLVLLIRHILLQTFLIIKFEVLKLFL